MAVNHDGSKMFPFPEGVSGMQHQEHALAFLPCMQVSPSDKQKVALLGFLAGLGRHSLWPNLVALWKM